MFVNVYGGLHLAMFSQATGKLFSRDVTPPLDALR
jgi:hypothetical protein